jgi:hypothetical protein
MKNRGIGVTCPPETVIRTYSAVNSDMGGAKFILVFNIIKK